MRKTLLLVFIHGFKGGDDTFGTFPEHIRALISHALPKIDVVAVTYPKFETRGDLNECVGRFREWLQNKVIDLEVAHSTPSPTVDPSVHVLLIGHSMGGIVGAETIALLTREQPIPAPLSASNAASTPNFPSNTTQSSTTATSHPNPPNDVNDTGASSLMFPHVMGLLTFDTPFLGVSPGVVAHGAESHVKTASNAYKTFNEVSSLFGWGSGGSSSSSSALGGASNASKVAGALPAPSTADAAAAPSWQSWGRYAMFAGAAGAVAAGASAAIYSQKDKISLGWGWVTGHLEFVGCLARGEELKQRVQTMSDISKERDMGYVDFYTCLGKGAREGYGASEQMLGDIRTFCSLPKKVLEDHQKFHPKISSSTSGNSALPPANNKTAPSSTFPPGLQWRPALNAKATSEILAHMSMFFPRDNPNFYTLGQEAKDWVVDQILHRSRSEKEWYEESTGEPTSTSPPTDPHSSDPRKNGTFFHNSNNDNSDAAAGDGGKTYGELGNEGWEHPDYEGDEEVKEKMREKQQTTTTINDEVGEEEEEFITDGYRESIDVDTGERIWMRDEADDDDDDDGKEGHMDVDGAGIKGMVTRSKGGTSAGGKSRGGGGGGGGAAGGESGGELSSSSIIVDKG